MLSYPFKVTCGNNVYKSQFQVTFSSYPLRSHVWGCLLSYLFHKPPEIRITGATVRDTISKLGTHPTYQEVSSLPWTYRRSRRREYRVYEARSRVIPKQEARRTVH